MAKFDMDFPADFLSGLLDADYEDIATDALDRSAPILTNSVETTMRGVIGKSDEHGNKYSTGAMVGSIKATKPKRTKTDAFIVVVRPTGKDSKGVRNMEKAAYMEYGTCKQGATPWLNKSVNDVSDQIIDVCQDVYNKKIGAK